MTIKSDSKKFVGHSLIYFIGNALNRLGVFVLLPLYTNYLTTEEYGILEIVLVTVAFLRVFLGMRLGHSTLRFFFEYENENDRKKLISTSILSVTFWCLILVSILILCSGHIARIISGTETYRMLFILGFLVMFFEVINEIPFAFFRAKEYSFLYVTGSLLQLILRVVLNIYIVIYLQGGVKGILTGNLLSAFIIWLLLSAFVFKYSGISFDTSKLKDLWRYSYPLVIAALPGLALRNTDRLFLSWYASLGAVGVYALAFRFGLALQGFILEPFQLGYGPFRFKIMNREDAPNVYSRITTYFLFAVMFIGLLISLLSQEVIELMASESFLNAYKVVPLLIFAIIMNGMTYIFQTGLFIKKRTSYFPYISTIAALINISSLFILVPLFGIYGAGFALVLTTSVEMTLTYIFSQRLYRIDFEYKRLIKIIVVTLIIYFASTLISTNSLWERFFIKICMIFLFPLLLAFLNFYKSDEKEKILALKERLGVKALSVIGIRR
jgi:O-antigen/teichoic acid export membrane protein